jgi:zinc protease
MKPTLSALFRVCFITVLTITVLAPALAQKADRTKPPELGPPPSLSLPSIQKATLSNGIPVVVMEKHTVPLVQINLLIRAGSAFESQEKTGLASLTAAMLKEGAGGKSSLELADAIDYLGASIGASADNQATRIYMNTPLSKLEDAFGLFADIALRPSFPANELERLRKERLTSLMQMHDQPTTIAAVAAAKLVFGENHPYGRGTMGNEKSIKGFTVDDLKGFYSQYYHAGNSAFIVVGDVKMPEIVAKLEKTFGTWQRGPAAATKIPTADQVRGRTIYLVDKPEAPQSVIEGWG